MNPVQFGRERMGPETRGCPGLPVVGRGEAPWQAGVVAKQQGTRVGGPRVVCQQSCLTQISQTVSDYGVWCRPEAEGVAAGRPRVSEAGDSAGVYLLTALVGRSEHDLSEATSIRNKERSDFTAAEKELVQRASGESHCPVGTAGRAGRAALRREWLIRVSLLRPRRRVAVLVMWAAG